MQIYQKVSYLWLFKPKNIFLHQPFNQPLIHHLKFERPPKFQHCRILHPILLQSKKEYGGSPRGALSRVGYAPLQDIKELCVIVSLCLCVKCRWTNSTLTMANA